MLPEQLQNVQGLDFCFQHVMKFQMCSGRSGKTEKRVDLPGERMFERVKGLKYSGGWITQVLIFCEESCNSNVGLEELLYPKLHNGTILSRL